MFGIFSKSWMIQTADFPHYKGFGQKRLLYFSEVQDNSLTLSLAALGPIGPRLFKDN